jgi:glycerol-3-phosphate dehydrogenase (NAD(P)+)
MLLTDLDTSRIALSTGPPGNILRVQIRPGQQARDHLLSRRRLCKSINRSISIHSSDGRSGPALGSMDEVPRLGPKVFATNDLERIVEDNDFIVLALTMNAFRNSSTT